jgi:hypothetical protein
MIRSRPSSLIAALRNLPQRVACGSCFLSGSRWTWPTLGSLAVAVGLIFETPLAPFGGGLVPGEVGTAVVVVAGESFSKSIPLSDGKIRLARRCPCRAVG